MKRLIQVDTYVARLIMVSFLLPMQLQVAFLFVPLVWFVFRTFKDKEAPGIINIISALLLGGMYFFYLLAPLITQTQYYSIAQKLIEYRLSYLLLPLCFSLLSPQKIAIIVQQLKWFVFSSIAACMVANSVFILKYIGLKTGFQGVT
ncbi:MAG: hypothetical protein H7257_01665, partial [Taibaiella sp.]|nr:hypothetical protein [Taibaiella sp.]